MKVLVIEDYEEIRSAFKDLFTDNFRNNVSVFEYPKHLTDFEICKNKLKNHILSFKCENIALATTFRLEHNSKFYNIFDAFLESILESEQVRNIIDTIMVYSYELENENESTIYSKIEELRYKFPSINFIDFETSVIFRKQPGIKLYNKINDKFYLNPSLTKYYVDLLSYGILNLLGEKTNEGLSLINKRNRELNYFIFNFNRYYARKTTPFKIGFLSFINPNEIENSYGIDSPFKPYYYDINQTILKNEYDLVFKSEDEYLKGFNCLYFRIYRQDNILKVFWDYPNKEKINEKSPDFFCSKGLDAPSFFNFWIKALYFSIYYKAVPIKNNTSINHSDYLEDDIKIEFITINDINELSQKHIEFFWFFSELNIPTFNYKGLINYSFFREYNDGAINRYNKESLNKQSKEIYNIDRLLLESKVFDTLYPYFNKNTRNYSLLNALSTVLNRNGSHNLGSHVLSILSSEDLVKQFLDKDRENDTSQNDSDIIYTPINYKHINWSGKDPKKQSKESLVAYFNAYLKNRLDLLAAIGTSGEAAMLNNKPLFKGVFKNFERNLILLEHISGKGEDFKYKFCLTVNDSSCTQNDIDIEVAIPNDLLGDQAFYLLLENIIRNTAKHGDYDSNKSVEFTINVNKKEYIDEDDFYAIEIWDNVCLDTRANKVILEKSDERRKEVVKETNERIDQNILRDDFNIREGGWGTIEMKIACCYLSGLPLTKIDNNAYKTGAGNNGRLPILEAFDKEITVDNEKSHHLAYRFYIQKPKSVLVIDVDNQLKEGDRKAKSLTVKGITILTNDELEEAITKRTIYKHQFMVAFAKAETDVTTQLDKWYDNKQLPNRVLKINEKDLISNNLLSNCHWQSFQDSLPKITKEPKYDLESKQRLVINLNGDFSYYDKLYSKFLENSDYNDFLALYSQEQIDYNLEAIFPHHSTAPTDEITRYVEPFGSISSLGLLFKQALIDNHSLYGILKEAINTKVLVIDERIQNGMVKTFKPDSGSGEIVSFKRIYKDTGVIIPDKKEVNLNKPKEEVHKIKKYITDALSKNQIDFFILHFGILEKIVINATKEGFKEFLTECREIQKEYPIKIVLTSGRGIPSDLPDDEYFCNFSSIDYYLSDSIGRSKPHLVQLLKNQRVK